MAEAPPPQGLPDDTDPDFEPLSRPRSCTWPLPRPELVDPASSATSSPAPSVQQEPAGAEFISGLGLLKEDFEEYAEEKQHCGVFQCQEGSCVQLHHLQQQQQAPQLPPQQQVPPSGVPRKMSSSRRNAWGNMSYADLITKAIESSPEKRLTLSQIYDWMVKSVPYFKDKGDSNSSAGWKNSIRHNLSLHSRFVRLQNEGTGKSSWWMLNPEGGKNGKSPRRRAVSMDNNNKFVKLRGRAAKKKMSLQEGLEVGSGSPVSQYSSWLGSPNSHSNDDLEAWSSFRGRTSSDASTVSGHCSPFTSEHDDLVEADGHMMYPGATGAKITLPSLSERSGSMSQGGSEHVMENLLDNLNLLSPKAHQLSSESSHSSNPAMLKSTSYSPTALTSEYHECMYGQVRMNSLSPAPMQTLPETKPGFGAYENQYICPAGLLKELLTADAEASRDTMTSCNPKGSEISRGSCRIPTFNSPSHLGCLTGIKTMTPLQSNSALRVNSGALHEHGSAAARDLNGCSIMPCFSAASPQLNRVRIGVQPHGQPAHTNDFFTSYGSSSSSSSYRDLNPVHQRGHHQERLPSDLDSVSIERLECDLESVLHDTLMDGGALDFNFDPVAGAHGFPERVKATTHSWVSG